MIVHRRWKHRAKKHWVTFVFRSHVFYRLPRRFPWNTFRPIFQSATDDRFMTMAFICARLLRPLSFARLSRSPSNQGFPSPIFPHLSMTDYTMSVCARSISIATVVGCITREWVHAVIARGICCTLIIRRTAGIIIKIYDV